MGKMKTEEAFYDFYKPLLKKTSLVIKKGKAVIFVGVNGIGKNLLASQILSTKFKKEFLKDTKTHFVFLNFKDKAPPTKNQLLDYWLSQTAKALKFKTGKLATLNEFTFYSRMERSIRKIGLEEKICFLVLDAQQILAQNDQFFDCLINLKYYSYGKVSYIFLSEPQILVHPNPSLKRFLQRLTNNKFIFLKTFDLKTILADIKREEKFFKTKFKKQQNLILKHSQGLHGMIRAFCLFLRKNPKIKSIKQLKKVLFTNKLYRFWIKEIFNSLPEESLRILKTVSQNPREIKNHQKSLYAQWLFQLELLKKNGESKQPLFLPVLKDMRVRKRKNQPLIKLAKNQFYFVGEKVKLTKKEFLTLRALYKSRGKTVNFDKLGNILWPNQPDNFSLWAITQTIRRLRKKLSYYFLDPKIIRSRREEGYFLEVK